MSRPARRAGASRPAPGQGSPFGPILDATLGVARRHPALVALVAVGAGFLAARVRQEARAPRARFGRPASAEDIPVINTGQARIYDPDLSPRHPMQDLMESQRELSARA